VYECWWLDDEVSDEGDNQEGDDEPQRSNSPEREEQSFNDPNYTRIAVVENVVFWNWLFRKELLSLRLVIIQDCN
jgi:hypothetical protein